MTWAGKGSTTQWRKTRARILNRDDHTCQITYDEGCTHRATQVHHVLGRGISERDSDLTSACAYCNQQIGNPQDNEDPEPETRTKW